MYLVLEYLSPLLQNNTVNWDILVWVKFGAFTPEWGGFILVCLILAFRRD